MVYVLVYGIALYSEMYAVCTMVKVNYFIDAASLASTQSISINSKSSIRQPCAILITFCKQANSNQEIRFVTSIRQSKHRQCIRR